MFMDWKNQYSENEYTTQAINRLDRISIKLPTIVFTDLEQRVRHDWATELNWEQIISQFVWKYKKLQIAKAILRKKNGTGGVNLPDSRLLQSYSHQDSIVLEQRQKYRSMEQNRKPRDKSMHQWTTYLWQKRQKYTMEKKRSL